LACFFPVKPGKDGLPFPSQAVVLTPSGQYDTNKAKLERPLPCLDMTRFQRTSTRNSVTPSHRFPLTSLNATLHAITRLLRKSGNSSIAGDELLIAWASRSSLPS